MVSDVTLTPKVVLSLSKCLAAHPLPRTNELSPTGTMTAAISKTKQRELQRGAKGTGFKAAAAAAAA